MTPLQVAEHILSQDNFSRWMGVKLNKIDKNYCLIEMKVKEEMVNGIGTVHGGATFAFAESALALSSLNDGQTKVALNCYINFNKAAKLGDTLTAESILINDTRKTAVYDISIKNQNNESIASFRGTVYKLDKKIID